MIPFIKCTKRTFPSCGCGGSHLDTVALARPDSLNTAARGLAAFAADMSHDWSADALNIKLASDQGANIAQPRYIWPPRLLMFSTLEDPNLAGTPRGPERFQPGRVFTPPEIEVTQ
jgi:hypothetical protein